MKHFEELKPVIFNNDLLISFYLLSAFKIRSTLIFTPACLHGIIQIFVSGYAGIPLPESSSAGSKRSRSNPSFMEIVGITKLLPHYGPASADTTHDSSEVIRAHYHPTPSSFVDIQRWVARVEETIALPPLTKEPAPHRLSYPENPHQRNRFFQISLPIPRYVSEDIRRQLAATINSRSYVVLLNQLPHPEKLPLVSIYILQVIYTTNICDIDPG